MNYNYEKHTYLMKWLEDHDSEERLAALV